jgi:hypothetical protein
VHQLGEGFGEAVAEGLGHDRGMKSSCCARKFGGELLDAMAGGDGEAAEVIEAAAVLSAR